MDRLLPSPRRARIDALAAGGAVEPHLDAWAASRGLVVGGWRRVFGRLQPPGSPWAVLAYEAVPGPAVRVLLHEPGPAPARAVPAGPLGAGPRHVPGRAGDGVTAGGPDAGR